MPNRSPAASPYIAALYRYPVKGLSADPLQQVTLAEGATMPLDRAWAIENGAGRFDPFAPRHLPKINFLMLMRNERLARLDCRFMEEAHTLAIHRDGRRVVAGSLDTAAGRTCLQQFFSSFMRDDLRGAPRIVNAEGHSFSDVSAKCLHIVSLASVRELERVVGRPIDPLRFRPNVVIDGGKPWQENSWIGRRIKAGGVVLEGFARTERCAATNVDPARGIRDLDLPSQLARRWGHTEFGIYARVSSAGTMARGDSIEMDVPESLPVSTAQ